MNKKCPKCKAMMKKGTRLDNLYGGVAPEAWVPEEFFNGKKIKSFGARGLFKSIGKYVSTYACTKCGFLESYADENVESKVT